MIHLRHVQIMPQARYLRLVLVTDPQMMQRRVERVPIITVGSRISWISSEDTTLQIWGHVL